MEVHIIINMLCLFIVSACIVGFIDTIMAAFDYLFSPWR